LQIKGKKSGGLPVPRVASEAQVHAQIHANRPLPASRPAPDQAAPTPFESVLDDSAPPPSDASAPRAERPDRAQRAAKSKDSTPSDDAKAAEAKPAITKSADDVTAEADNDGKLIKASQKTLDFAPIAEANATDTKLADQPANTDSKQVTDANPAAALVVADTVAAALSPFAAVIPAAATEVAPAPDAAPEAAALAAASAPIVAAPKAKSEESPKAQGTGKAANQPKLAAKAAPEASTEAKPQVAAAGDAETDTHARGETPGNEHHAAPAQTPVSHPADTDTVTAKPAADIFPQTTMTAPSVHTAATARTDVATAPAPAAPHASAIPLAGVAIEIASKAVAGTNHFEIRLDPPELGRIEVRLDVDGDGNVTTRMIADRSETLDLLRRDASGLERALQDAGLKTADNSLQFSLRDHSAQHRDTSDTHTARLVVEDTTLPAIDAARGYSRLAGQGSGIDIHV